MAGAAWIAVQAGVPARFRALVPANRRKRSAEHKPSVPPCGSFPATKERSLAERANPNSQEPAIVVQRAYDLALWTIRKVEKFPRSFRFSVGDRVVARALDVLEALAEAAYSSDKSALLDRANRSVNSLRLLLRLTVELRLLGGDSHEFAAAKLEEIGRMIGGWRKSVARRTPT